MTAESVLLEEVRQGQEQVVVFTGFTPGETATVQIVDNDQVEIPDVQADDSGAVRVSWTVPEDFPPAAYRMQVDGQESLRVGVVDFTVAAVVVPPSSASSTSAPSSTPSSTPASSTPPSTTSSPPSSRTPPSRSSSSAVTSSSAAAPPAAAAEESGTPWGLLVTLLALLLIGLVVGAVFLGRRHRREADEDRRRREAELADAAATETARHPEPPVPPADPGYAGLDEHPDRPVLFSHRQAENYSPPTEVIGSPDASTEAIRTPGPADDPPPTGAWTPDFTGTTPAGGPGTQQFDPFADDPADAAADSTDHPVEDPEPEGGPGTQQFDPFADDSVDDADEPGENDTNGPPDDGPGWQPPR